jgi:hypothetical protein
MYNNAITAARLRHVPLIALTAALAPTTFDGLLSVKIGSHTE